MEDEEKKREEGVRVGGAAPLDPQPEEMKGASPQPAVSAPAAADACRAQEPQ